MNDGSISMDLYQFLATNFHQDWDLEADDWQVIVDAYVREDPTPEPIQALAGEIGELCAARAEPDLEQFLVYSVGVDYDPRPLTYRKWLGQIAERLRRHASAAENHTAG